MADENKKNDEEVSKKKEADEMCKQEEKVRANAPSEQSKQVAQEKKANSTCDSSISAELRSTSLTKNNPLDESKDKTPSVESNEEQTNCLPNESRLNSAGKSVGSSCPQVLMQSAYEKYICAQNRRINLLTDTGITKDSKVDSGTDLVSSKSDQIQQDIKKQLKSIKNRYKEWINLKKNKSN